MKIDGKGWLIKANKAISPYYEQRPDVDDISLLVIHSISLPPGEFGTGYVDDLFKGELEVNAHPYFAEINHRVSTHVMIDRTGLLTQYVSFFDRAWHAGPSCFQGRAECNDFSIGIELEGVDDIPFTNAQYVTLIELSQSLLVHFPRLSAERIVGHNEIAPGRKTDPGKSFDWQRVKKALGE